MQTVLDALRDVLGNPTFWRQMPSNSSGGYTNYQWDYGAMLEYFVASLVLLIVVSSVFRIVARLFK